MKCPVCKGKLKTSDSMCPNCDFSDLANEFINIAEAKHWEKTVVLPYRMAWKTGCLQEKDEWIQRELKWQIDYEASDQEQKSNLVLNSRDDLNIDSPENIRSILIKGYPEDIEQILSDFKKFINLDKLWFSYEYSQEINPIAINKLFEICPGIVTLHISKGINWSVISKINMMQIKYLYVWVQEATFPMVLHAENLRELTIGSYLGKEYNKQKKSFDFSGTPLLEKLDIKKFSKFDYTSLSRLPELKELTISESDVCTLTWISSKYKLEELRISSGKLTSLDGLEKQTALRVLDLGFNSISDLQGLEKLKSLQRLCLRFNQITDASVISQLSQLKYLDLFKNNIEDEMYLRQLNIPTTILTKRDRDFSRLEEFFDGNKFHSISVEAYRWIKSRDASDPNKMPPYRKRAHERWLLSPYSEKLKVAIQMVFQRNYNYYFFEALPSSQFDHSLKRVYIEKSLNHYPFLELTETMRADME